MKRTRDVIGTGITQRERVTLFRIDEHGVYEHPDAAMQRSWGGVANIAQDTSKWAAAVLHEAGLPSSYGQFWLSPDGGYRDVTGLSWKEYCTLTSLRSPPLPCDLLGLVHHKGLQIDSPAGYAARLLALLWRLERASDNVQQSVECAFEFGYLARECGMKLHWERYALHGQKKVADLRDTAATANATRKTAAEQKRADWQRIADDLFAAKPRESKLWAADQIILKTGASENRDTIAGRIKKPPKAG